MKRINKNIPIITLVIVAGSGCKKAWFDINQDPNRAVESNITPDLVAPQALLATANRAGTGFGFLGNWLGYWCPAANYAPNVEEQSYNITTNFQAGQFSGIMDNTYDYVFMEKKAVETDQGFYEGIARIMKSHNFAQLVDLYNDIPYSQALKGLEAIRPAYDDGQAVYEDLIKQIDTGIAKIKTADPAKNLNITAADIMFNGDKALWVKFANTLKLRLLMHQSKRADRQAYITAEIAKIVAEGSGFLESGEDASLTPVYQSDKPNAFYASYGFTQTGTQATDFWRANITAMNYLKNNNDLKRLAAYYKPITNSLPAGASEPFTQPAPTNFRGNEYGRGIDNVTYPYQTANYVSQVGGISAAAAVSASASGLIKGYNQRMWIMTSVESLFLQAEAIQVGYLTGNAQAAYEAALLETFLWLNVDGSATAATAAYTNFYAANGGNPNVDFAAATDKLKVIYYQKYLALNGTLYLETWNDFRKVTGGVAQTSASQYPLIPLSVNPGRTSTVLPVRLLYPQREIDLNTANVPALGTKSGDQLREDLVDAINDKHYKHLFK